MRYDEEAVKKLKDKIRKKQRREEGESRHKRRRKEDEEKRTGAKVQKGQ